MGSEIARLLKKMVPEASISVILGVFDCEGEFLRQAEVPFGVEDHGFPAQDRRFAAQDRDFAAQDRGFAREDGQP
jgi:hypothetical protein